MTRRGITILALIFGCGICGTPRDAAGQAALQRLERRLAQQQPASPPAAPLVQPVPPKVADLPPPASEEPGYLGIIADDKDTQGRGVRLVDVLAGGPAALGGLKIGDLITSIDGVAVADLDAMAAIMKGRIVGEEVTFVVLREGDVARLDIVLTKRPPPEERRFANFGRIGEGDPGAAPAVTAAPSNVPPQPNMPILPGATAIQTPPATTTVEPLPSYAPADPPPGAPTPSIAIGPRDPNGPAATAARTGLLGIRTARVTPELQSAMNLPEPRGALVIEVRPDSPAKAAGIPVDAVIVAVDAKRVNDPNDLLEAVRERGPGAEVRLSFYRYGQLYERRVKLEAPPAAAPIVDAPIAPSVGPAITVPQALPPASVPPVAPSAAAPMSDDAEKAELRRRVAELERQIAEIKGRLESGEPSPKK